jgi:hypothetical protein
MDSWHHGVNAKAEELDPNWVILQRRDQGGFEQVGPFSARQIMQRLAAGELQYGDFAWKSGYEKWVRIGNVPELDRRCAERREHVYRSESGSEGLLAKDLSEPCAKFNGEDLLGSVVRFRPTEKSILRDEVPDEASGPDLAQGAINNYTFFDSLTNVENNNERAINLHNSAHDLTLDSPLEVSGEMEASSLKESLSKNHQKASVDAADEQAHSVRSFASIGAKQKSMRSPLVFLSQILAIGFLLGLIFSAILSHQFLP